MHILTGSLKENINILDNGFESNKVMKYKGTSPEFVLFLAETKHQQ